MRLDRRTFIKLIPITAVAALSGAWWFLRQTANEPMVTSQATTGTSVTTQAALTASVAPQATTATLEATDFPVTWNGDRPTRVDTKTYRLKIDGNVPRPQELTLEQLFAMTHVQKTVRIECVLGWAASVLWEGISLSYLVSQAGASLKNLTQVRVEGVTGYATTMNSDELANPDSMIALKANGLPLSIEHGYPARLVAPTKPGVDWVKYVTRITCTGP